MCTELFNISKVIDSRHIDISNPLSIINVISLLKLCMDKAGDTRRDLKILKVQDQAKQPRYTHIITECSCTRTKTFDSGHEF